jgi:hypothetical protein
VKRFAKDDGSIPYGLEVKADIDDRCSEGGFKFDWIDVVVVDLRSNEQVMALRGEGYTENCKHWGQSGTLFSEMADELLRYWTTEPG